MEKENNYCNDLRNIRMRRGLRQIDVANLIGHTSSDRISHWEKGIAYPSIVNLFKLAHIYGTTPEQLYGDLHASILSELQTTTDEIAGLRSIPLHRQKEGYEDVRPQNHK